MASNFQQKHSRLIKAYRWSIKSRHVWLESTKTSSNEIRRCFLCFRLCLTWPHCSLWYWEILNSSSWRHICKYCLPNWFKTALSPKIFWIPLKPIPYRQIQYQAGEQILIKETRYQDTASLLTKLKCKVRQYDTLGSIAKRYGVAVTKILDLIPNIDNTDYMVSGKHIVVRLSRTASPRASACAYHVYSPLVHTYSIVKRGEICKLTSEASDSESLICLKWIPVWTATLSVQISRSIQKKLA